MANSMTNHEIEAELRKVLKINMGNDLPADTFTENKNGSQPQTEFSLLSNATSVPVVNSRQPSAYGIVGAFSVADIELANNAPINKVKGEDVGSKSKQTKKMHDRNGKHLDNVKTDDKVTSQQQSNNFNSILNEKAISNLSLMASADLNTSKSSDERKIKSKKNFPSKEPRSNDKSNSRQEKSKANTDDNRKIGTNLDSNGPPRNFTTKAEILKKLNSGDIKIVNEGSLKVAEVAAQTLEKIDLASYETCHVRSLPDEIMSVLKCQHIKPYKKRFRKHPKAKFVCYLCDVYCSTLGNCISHIRCSRHHASLQKEQVDITLKQLPDPCDYQLESIEKLLQGIYDAVSLKTSSILQRRAIVDTLATFGKGTLPKTSELKLYGSSYSSLGLKDCNANINLTVATSATLHPGSVLKKMLSLLTKHSDEFTEVASDFEAKLPTIYFRHKSSSIRCVLGINNQAAVLTSEILADYAMLDKRAKILCVALRHWAKICKIDKQVEGTLPPHAFDILVIYFLQRLSPPVLPVLYDSENSKLNRTAIISSWEIKNHMSAASLWVELLRYYALTFPNSGNVATIRSLSGITVSQKNWRNKMIAIEDPLMTARNLARSISSPNVSEFIINCFKLTFKYFGIPQTDAGPLFKQIDLPDSAEMLAQNTDVKSSSKVCHSESGPSKNGPKEVQNVDHVNRECADDEVLFLSEDDSSDSDSDVNEVNIHLAKSNDDMNAHKNDSKDQRDSKNNLKVDDSNWLKKNRFPTPEHILELIKTVKKNQYKYRFIRVDLTGGKYPAIECSVCHKEGHIKRDCPDEKLPALCLLPPMTANFLKDIGNICDDIYKTCSPTKEEVNERERLITGMQDFIQGFYPDAELELFGSSCNGFGFKRSDLDICLTFKGKITGEEINYGEIVTNLAEKLKLQTAFSSVVAIPTAKVPIVKFTHTKTQLECDISLYNTLGKCNTQMLLLYSKIDDRVTLLGYVMKYFAKLCDICDASRGSLSSYAYTLMVLYFLQQRNPPVIPVLQELCDEGSQPGKNMIDGWNAWYYSDLKNLEKVWPDKGKNKEDIGELWLGLLRFYTEEFKFKEHVISIRQHKILTRFEKLWNSRHIAIEDPFDLSHNLGSGVFDKMSIYIRKTFIRGREVFGKPINLFPKSSVQMLRDILFDKRQLVEGPPPNDRGCRICGKIGHKVRDCPKRKASKQHRKMKISEQKGIKNQTTNDTAFKNANLAANRPMPNLNQQPMSNPFANIRPLENVRMFPSNFSTMVNVRKATPAPPLNWSATPRPFIQPNLNQRVPVSYVSANRLPSPFPPQRPSILPNSNIRMNIPMNLQQGNAFLDHQPSHNSFRP